METAPVSVETPLFHGETPKRPEKHYLPCFWLPLLPRTCRRTAAALGTAVPSWVNAEQLCPRLGPVDQLSGVTQHTLIGLFDFSLPSLLD